MRVTSHPADYCSILQMRIQPLQTILRASARVLTRPQPLYRVACAAHVACSRCHSYNTGKLNPKYASKSARFLSTRDNSQDSSDQSDTDAEDLHARDEVAKSDIDELSDDDASARFLSTRDTSQDSSDQSDTDADDLRSRDRVAKSDIDELSEDEASDTVYSDHGIFEAFQSELALDETEEKELKASQKKTHPDPLSEEKPVKDEPGKKRWNRKERVKACLDKLKRGPDGRYINVLEVATEVDMLIASYVKLRYKDDPSLVENSDEDERLIEGIDIEKFKRLSKRVRDGTYEFQPIVKVPLPKRKILRKKKKKVKKQHPF